MKKLIALISVLSLLFMLNACEDSLTIGIDTNFKMNMNIDVTDGAKAKANTFPFSETQILNIEDDEEVANEIERMKDIDVTEIECEVTGIPSGQSIPSLKIYIEEVDLTVTLTDITEDYTLTLPVSDELLDTLGNYLYENHKTTVTVSGESTYAPMVLGVKLNFKSKIAATI